MSEDEFVEAGAELEHARWSRWQRHLHNLCERQRDGSLLIPAWCVRRWESQIAAPYSDLCNGEKESDRREVREYLPLLRAFQAPLIEALEKIATHDHPAVASDSFWSSQARDWIALARAALSRAHPNGSPQAVCEQDEGRGSSEP